MSDIDDEIIYENVVIDASLSSELKECNISSSCHMLEQVIYDVPQDCTNKDQFITSPKNLIMPHLHEDPPNLPYKKLDMAMEELEVQSLRHFTNSRKDNFTGDKSNSGF